MNLEQSWNLMKKDSRIPLLGMCLVLVLLIYYLYSLVGDFMRPIGVVDAIPQSLHIARLSPVSQWHLFGAYNDESTVLPITQLQLTLQGIMLSPDHQNQSYAIIQGPDRPAKVYKVGDEIPGDATLKEILKDRVVISYQGTLQSLLLPILKLNAA